MTAFATVSSPASAAPALAPALPPERIAELQAAYAPVGFEQRLERLAIVQAFDQLADGFWLVARRRVRLEQLEGRIGETDEFAVLLFRYDLCDIRDGFSQRLRGAGR